MLSVDLTVVYEIIGLSSKSRLSITTLHALERGLRENLCVTLIVRVRFVEKFNGH